MNHMASHVDQAAPSPRSTEELLFWMPSIPKKPWASDWEKDFARSILACSKRRNWSPTNKQRATMERLVAQMFDDTEVIDVS